MTLPGSGRIGSRRSLSLIELMVATVILVVGIMGLLTSIAQTVVLDGLTSEKTAATNAARVEMEKARSTSFADLLATYGAGAYNFSVPGLQALPSDGDGQPGSVVATAVAADALTTARIDLVVTIEWRSNRGGNAANENRAQVVLRSRVSDW